MTITFSLRQFLASTGFLFALSSSSLLSGCASGPESMVDPDTPPLMASRAFPGHVKSVLVDDREVDLCNGCAGRVGNPGYFVSIFRRTLQNELPVRISNLLGNGKAVNRSASRPLDMRVKLKQFQVELGFGIAKIFMVAEYQLTENRNVIASWVVPSYGVSDALATQNNSYEAMLSAINSNAASFYLRFISDTSPSDAALASKELAAMDSKMQAEMKKSGNPVWGALGWTAVTIVKGAQSVGKALDSAGASYARYCEGNADECARNRGSVGTQANIATLNRFSEMTQANVDRINAQNQQLNEAIKIRKDTEAKVQDDQRAYRQELARSNATPIPISPSPSSSADASKPSSRAPEQSKSPTQTSKPSSSSAVAPGITLTQVERPVEKEKPQEKRFTPHENFREPSPYWEEDPRNPESKRKGATGWGEGKSRAEACSAAQSSYAKRVAQLNANGVQLTEPTGCTCHANPGLFSDTREMYALQGYDNWQCTIFARTIDNRPKGIGRSQ